MSTNPQNIRETASNVADQAKGFADQAKDTAQRTVDSVTEQSKEKFGQLSDQAMDAVQKATDYLENVDVRGRLDDAWQAMKRNPAPSIVAALAVGFILGASIRRSS